MKKADLECYVALHIVGGVAPSALAQVGTALRTQGPLVGYNVRHGPLAGHSQTGNMSSSFIHRAHETHRRASGGVYLI